MIQMRHWRRPKAMVAVIVATITMTASAGAAADGAAQAQAQVTVSSAPASVAGPTPLQQPLPWVDGEGEAIPDGIQRKLSPDLIDALAAAGPGDRIAVVVRQTEAVDVASVAAADPSVDNSRRAAHRRLVTELVAKGVNKRRNIEAVLRQRQRRGDVGPLTPLWIINGFAIDANPAVIRQLARRSDVASIALDVPVAELQAGANPEPNLVTVGAPTYWGLGYDGSGVVVGVIDSGADGAATELAATWRGGTNSWIDYVDASPTPIDPPDSLGVPHGTVSTGVVVGGDQSGTAIGMAPGAQWIAARTFNQQRQATTADLHSAFQWMLDPDGNPTTHDQPAVVNNSWVIVSGACDLEFAADVQALVGAGILPVFAAGNAGTTSEGASPANYVDAFAVGAVDGNDDLWDDSPFGATNQGPTTCGTPGTSRIFPDLVAPGADIKTVEGLAFYFSRSGTSVAAPHVTGAAALLLSEFPALTVAELRNALEAGAVDLGPVGPDNGFGNGRLDVMAARAHLRQGSIGDFVWSDSDGDGTFEPGEPGLDGVTLTLSGPGPDGTLGTADDVILDTTSTDLLGQYGFGGLGPGQHRVAVDPATVAPGSTLTTGTAFIDVTLAVGENRDDVDFGYAPPPPGSISGVVWDDADADGVRQGTEVGLGAVAVDLVAPGLDDVFDTADDVIVDAVVTGTGGDYQFLAVVPGNYRVTVQTNTLPPGATSTTGGFVVDVTVGPGQDVIDIDIGVDLSTPDTIYFSLAENGQLSGGPFFSDEDIVSWDGTSYTRFFDGSDVGLAATDLIGFQVIDESTIAFTVNQEVTLPGVGLVDDSDIVLFTGTTGPSTQGTFTMHFDGSDVGLTTANEDIDALDILADGTILISTRGAVRVPGLWRQQDEDVLAFLPSSLGDDTAGLWSHWFDGSDVELTETSEDVGAIDSDGIDLLVSTVGNISVTGFNGADHDVARCSNWGIGPATTCQWGSQLVGSTIGLDPFDIDGMTIRPEDQGSIGPSVGPRLLSIEDDGFVNGGALPVEDGDLLLWDGATFSLLFDASDVGITADLDAAHQVDATTLLLSFDDDVTIGGTTFDDADLVQFVGQLGPTTSGVFTTVIDGSDIGLVYNAGDIDAVHADDDGSYVLSIVGTRTLPDVGTVADRDLLRFTPTTIGPDTTGTWSMVMVGSNNGLNSLGEDINALSIDGDAHIVSSLRQNNVGIGTYKKRDGIRCLLSPTGNCTWTLEFEGDSIGLLETAIDAMSPADGFGS